MKTEVSGTLMFHSNGDSAMVLQEAAGIVESFQRLGYPVTVTISIALEGEVEHTPPNVQEAAPATGNFTKQATADNSVKAIDWGVTGLTSVAHQALMALEDRTTTWRKLSKWVRLELIQCVLAQPTASRQAMTMAEYDALRPVWMPVASGLPVTFECGWNELPTLRLVAQG